MDAFWTILAALVVGASLGLSGAVLQGVLRNPLADPYLLGMVGGGTLFMVLALNLGLATWGALVLPLASLLGAAFALLLVAFIAWRTVRARARDGSDAQARASNSSVILAGWAVGGTLGSFDLLALSYATPENRDAVNCWLWGSLSTARPQTILLGCLVFLAVFAVVMALRRSLDVMELGHDEAACLGVNVRLASVAAVSAAALATSVSVALAGMVGFVGLVIPHVVRRLFGARMSRVLPLSAVFGALFVLAAEGVGRALPGSVGVGIVCAITGGPVFLALLASRRNGEGRDV